MYPEIEGYEVIYNDILKQYRALFKIKGNSFTAYFNTEGNWTESYVEIADEYIPQIIKKGIANSVYKDWRYSEPELYQLPNAILYRIYVEKGLQGYFLRNE